jgi:hypothetical protein
MSELDLGGFVATRLLLHIGTQKSGTTYLQRALERLAVKMRDQGVLYPIRLVGKKEIYNHEPASYGLLGREHYPWVPQVRADAERPAWEVLVKKVREWPGTAIVSGEAISVVRRSGAEQLVSSLDVADTQIIITARDLGRVIPSSWQQHIRNGRSSKMPAYIQTLANKRRGDLAADEALWESDPDLTFWRAYAIGSLVKRWQSVVGSDRVTVVTVPGREAGPDALWLRFREGLGLNDALPTNPPKVDTLTANVGLTEAEVLLLAAFNKAVEGQGFDPKDVRAIRMRMINEALTTRAHRGKSVALPTDRLELVRSWAEQDVHALTQSGARVVGDINELLPSAQAVENGGPDLDDLERAAGQALALLSGLASDTKNA